MGVGRAERGCVGGHASPSPAGFISPDRWFNKALPREDR